MKNYPLKTSLALLVASALVLFLSLSVLATLVTEMYAVSGLSVMPGYDFRLLKDVHETNSARVNLFMDKMYSSMP